MPFFLSIYHWIHLALYWLFFSGFGVNFYNPPANGKQGPIPEKMSQTLLAK
jgi:hypothetical protein